MAASHGIALARSAVIVVAAVIGAAACGDDAPGHRMAARDAGLAQAFAHDAADALTADSRAGADTRQDAVAHDSGALEPADTGPAPTDTANQDTQPTTGPRPRLSAPRVALPAVQAGGGGVSAALTLHNDGGAGAISVTLTGADGLHLQSPPTQLGAGASVPVTVVFDGADGPSTHRGTLRVEAGAVAAEAVVWAVAVDPAIPEATWEELSSPDGVVRGASTVVALPTAPYPSPGGSWTDAGVLVFVPDGYRDRGSSDLVVHFHGHRAEVADIVDRHALREQLHLSGANAVLVAPQGPVNANSGDFGKLMEAGGLEALAADVIAVLYRDGFVRSPVVGDLVLTAHSGGYQAVAENLEAATEGGQTTHAALFDGLYARRSQYVTFVDQGGFFRSNYTASGGTADQNGQIMATLGAASSPTFRALRDDAAVVWFVDTTHQLAPVDAHSYAEVLRWAARRSRQGPRLELRSVRVEGGRLAARWLAPDDDDVVGYLLETSADGQAWREAAAVSSDAVAADAPADAAHRWVRVRPQVVGVASPLASNAVAAAGGGARAVLVVDGFDRRVGGSFGVLRHGLYGRVGALIGAQASATNEAVVAGEVSLEDFDAVVWLIGDESTGNHAMSAAEQAAVTAYLDGGGACVLSGSEVGWDLGAKDNGRPFLTALGARYVADDADATTVLGTGALASLAAFGYAGPGAAYVEDFPDVIGPAGGGETVLAYAGGASAAAGLAGRSVIVGFPLELIDEDDDLRRVVGALLDFVDPPL